LLYAHLTTGARPNQNPVAAADTGTTQVDTPVTVAVLANDSDPDGDPLTVAQISSPTSGTATLNADQTITYTPGSGFTGTDAFTYTVSDGRGGTAVGTVAVTVNSGQNTVHVENIAMALLPSGKNWKAQATILIHDQSAQPKAGAVIYGDWYFKGNLTQSGAYATADTTGQAVLVSPPAKAVVGDTFTFVVTDIVFSGYGYDPGQNTETQDSITMQ
jgi:hypothetical protein